MSLKITICCDSKEFFSYVCHVLGLDAGTVIISKGAVDGMLSPNFESVSSHFIGTTLK